MIKAAGHFKETQNGAFISAGLNVVITVTLVFKLGLIGVALGTLVSMLYHTCYFVRYLKKNILNRSVRYFVKYLITDIVVAVISYWITKGLTMSTESYLAWVILAIEVTVIVFLVTAVVNALVYREQVKNAFVLLKRR